MVKITYEKVKEYIIKQRENAPRCTVCGCVLFDYLKELDDFFFKQHNYVRVSSSEMDEIYSLMYVSFAYKDSNSLVNHHVNYMLDITIPVCTSCHAKIHNSRDKKYEKYKSYDKRL